MTTKPRAAGPRRTPPPALGHREYKALLALGALCAVLGGWLALARETPVTAGTASLGSTEVVSVPAVISSPGLNRAVGALVPVPIAAPAQPRPITRTRSSR